MPTRDPRVPAADIGPQRPGELWPSHAVRRAAQVRADWIMEVGLQRSARNSTARVSRLRPSIVMLQALWALSAAPQLHAQRIVNVESRIACPRCEVVLKAGPRLGDNEGLGALVAEPSSLASDNMGRFFLTQFTNAEGPLVFDSLGRFVRQLGRRGLGPGEFQVARYLSIAASDSIYVADPQAGRMSVFTPTRNSPGPLATGPVAGIPLKQSHKGRS